MPRHKPTQRQTEGMSLFYPGRNQQGPAIPVNHVMLVCRSCGVVGTVSEHSALSEAHTHNVENHPRRIARDKHITFHLTMDTVNEPNTEREES